MADMASEISALLDLIESESKELTERNPDHELLKFITVATGRGAWVPEVHEEFLERFDPDKNKKARQVRVAYYKALRVANGKPEIDRSGRKREHTRSSHLIKLDEEEIPF